MKRHSEDLLTAQTQGHDQDDEGQENDDQNDHTAKEEDRQQNHEGTLNHYSMYRNRIQHARIKKS